MALRCSYAGAGLCLSWEFGRKVRGMIEPSCLNPFPSWAEKLQTTAVAMGPDWDPADVKVFGSPFLRFPLRVYTACHRFPPLGLSHPETQPERTCVLYSPGAVSSSSLLCSLHRYSFGAWGWGRGSVAIPTGWRR